jgi:hypothetical protein
VGGFECWQQEALDADGLPEIGDINEDGGVVCVSLTAKSLDDQGTATIDVRWQEDPLTLPIEVHYYTSSKTKPAWRGQGSEPGEVPFLLDDVEDIRNSAGDRFNPPVTYEAAMERIEVVMHVSMTWHDETIAWENYVKHWNENEFVVAQSDPDGQYRTERTFPAGSVMFMDKRAVLVKEPYFHRLVTCTFLYDPDLWGQRVPDMGPRCYAHAGPSSDGKTTVSIPYKPIGLGPVTDCLSHPYGGAAELDGEGNQMIPTGTPPAMPAAIIRQWWPVNENEKVLSADFDELELFNPERTAQ